jgi:predicted dehydrogenase
VILRHENGTLSSIVSSHAIQRYRRPGLEIYGTSGTANLLGDDWDPRGFEIWRNESNCWEEYEPVEPTWLWADGLAELAAALREGRSPLHDNRHDLHLIEVIDACSASARSGRFVPLRSRFPALDLRAAKMPERHTLHDHTRPSDEQ